MISFAGGEWSLEASQAIVELTQFRTQQAQITSYTENGLPEIRLYSFLSPNVSEFAFYFNDQYQFFDPNQCSMAIVVVFQLIILKFSFFVAEHRVHQSRASCKELC